MSDLIAHDFPSAEDLGSWLPQYEVQQQIHVGPDAALYVGLQSALDRKVEIEVIPEPAGPAAEGLLERLRRRARLVHPSITAIYDFGRTPGGQFYLVGEHVEGTPLASLIEDRQLKPKAAFPLALQICAALQAVHDLKLPHGSLNTQTVMVTPGGQAKLIGVGMVQTESGELSWLEPFHGSLVADIRALGLTLHWMFAKCEPDPAGRLARDLPPAFASVLRRCLEADSPRHFTRPDDVAVALKEALRGEQEKTESPTRSRMVVALGAKPTADLAPAPVPAAPPVSAPTASAPPKLAPGQLAPVVRHHQPTFFQRMDAFVWKAFSTGLHLMITLVSVGSLILLILLKDKIIIEQDNTLPMATLEDVGHVDAPLPGEVLGTLPPIQTLPTAAPVVKPIVLPPSAPVVTTADHLADLRTQYIAAVQSAANHALEKVLLDDLPHLQRELQLLQGGGEIPAVDEPNLPDSLKALRQRYRESYDQITR